MIQLGASKVATPISLLCEQIWPSYLTKFYEIFIIEEVVDCCGGRDIHSVVFAFFSVYEVTPSPSNRSCWCWNGRLLSYGICLWMGDGEFLSMNIH